MPSPLFAALAAQAARAADAVTAESWILVPMKDAPEKDAARVPDPSRSGVAFVATFTDREAKPDANGYDRRQQRRPGVVAGKAGALVSPAALADAAAAGAPLIVLQGDRLRRASGGLWHVASAFPMSGGTLSLGIDLLG